MVSAALCALIASCGSSAEGTVATVPEVAEETVEQATEPASDEHADDEHADDEHSDDEHADDEHADDEHSDDEHADDEHSDDEHSDDEHSDDEHSDDEHEHEDHDDHADDVSGGLDAHVHGAAELFVAWNADQVVIDLISPADNIFGFEYEPTTEQDQAIVEDQTRALAEPGVISINAEAGCTLVEDVEPDFVVDGSHAEVTTSWVYTCNHPEEIRELDATTLFETFPRLIDLDVQWASDAAQSATELSPSSTVLILTAE